ncbi:Pr6Pr family membrane protein [Kumtagia ephedrae]|uniref:Pr6Pr family membrane protein n=1 Tax=Kumtagia ephedrae TaxID=2116701 RepID=A0A2P7ST41_9HYPH|nr:Pr6Pr family membrane protein [Mesorhizobium ephedrae]PSJ65617.1 hypothetical protein C7I84_00350 [Mesorhizobium ephedrae]
MARLLQLAGLIVGAGGLALQAAITIPASIEAGRGPIAPIVFFLSFFTILTNFGAVFVHAASLFGSGRDGPPFFARPRVRAGVAVAMTVVLVVYATMLAHLWKPQGLFLLCDILLHYVTPVLFVGWWLLFGADGSSRWRDIPFWLIYPFAYLAYVLARAPLAGEVPYPFLDVGTNGIGGVAAMALAVAALFVVLGILAVLVDGAISRRRAAAAGLT